MTSANLPIRCFAVAAVIALAITARIQFKKWNGTIAPKEVSGASVTDQHQLAIIRDQPLRLPVRDDLKSLVSDRELEMALEIAVPRWDPPTVPIMLHSLRLWGSDATFPVSPKAPSLIVNCPDFRRILLHNDECVKVVGRFDEFLIDTKFGVRVLTFGDPVKVSLNSEGHCDQMLKMLGECGIPASEEIQTSSGRHATVGELLQDSIARFTLLQELEFSACAYSRWLPPNNRWENRFGEQFTFDDLISELAKTPLGKGSCQGCHVPYALTNILLAAQEYPTLISPAARKLLDVRLREISLCLEASELPAGGWDKRWSGQYEEAPENIFFELKPHFDRISATGHHLEWIALVPPDLRPSAPIVERATKALIAELNGLSDTDLAKPKGFLPVTHAVRALCLTRGHDSGFSLWTELKARSTKAARSASRS